MVWPFWNRMSSASRLRPLVRGYHPILSVGGSQEKHKTDLTIEKLL